MTKEEFLYAAYCNGGESARKRAKEYAANTRKQDFTCDDYIAVLPQEKTEPIGSRRIGTTELPYSSGRTTRFCRKAPDDDPALSYEERW